MQNLKFTPIEQPFKFQTEALEALKKYSFDDIVYTTKEEIAVINEHNDSINLEKRALKRKYYIILYYHVFVFIYHPLYNLNPLHVLHI